MSTGYLLTTEEVAKLRALSEALQTDDLMRKLSAPTETAFAGLRGILHKLRPVRKAKGLKPREACIICGTIGADAPAKKPLCPVCNQPFTRQTPWRLWHGRRLHIACIQ